MTPSTTTALKSNKQRKLIKSSLSTKSGAKFHKKNIKAFEGSPSHKDGIAKLALMAEAKSLVVMKDKMPSLDIK